MLRGISTKFNELRSPPMALSIGKVLIILVQLRARRDHGCKGLVAESIRLYDTIEGSVEHFLSKSFVAVIRRFSFTRIRTGLFSECTGMSGIYFPDSPLCAFF